MRNYRLLICMVLMPILGACSRGDSAGSNTTALGLSDPNSFLIFPNPQAQADGSFQLDSTAYAEAYYAAIDPGNTKTTLEDWKTQNGFYSGTGQEVTVVFQDKRDLGYGRRMTARRNADGTVAVMVENYNVVVPGQSNYSALNVDAAVNSDSKWHIGTNAIEFSPAPNGQTFAKFYSFSPTTGARLLAVDLDGRGPKAVPTPCVVCHGGRGDPLTASGAFPSGGNTRGQLQPLQVDSFAFSAAAGYARADQESELKAINQFVLCTYPLADGTTKPTGYSEDDCRSIATFDEWGSQWQSTAAEMIKAWYGGNGMTASTFSDSYVPSGWVGHEALYQNVVAPYCRSCHLLRGTASQHAIDFTTYDIADNPLDIKTKDDFRGYADRIKAHVIDRGNMPLALLIYQNFWNSSAPETLATFLESEGYSVRDSKGAVLRPGRPIADPGPDRTTRVPVALSAANSLYANSYSWSIVSTPTMATATLDGASASSSVHPVFNGNTDGTYVVQLVVGNGSDTSAPVQFKLTVDSTLTPAPSAIHFSDIKALLQDTSLVGCTGCHTDAASSGATGTPPWEPLASAPSIFYTDYNRGGTPGTAGDGIYDSNATDDDYWFYLAMRGRINFTDVAASPLLRKPAGYHHGGGYVLNSSDATACVASPGWPACLPYSTLGEYYAAQRNLLVNWILNGAPYN
jgi:mono/diheme cytochrome c family protein